jgi:hypothetical protein
LLYGGSGADIFWLQPGTGTDTMQDFVVGQDPLGMLDTTGTPDQFTYNQNSIWLGDELVAVLNKVNTTNVGAALFTTV